MSAATIIQTFQQVHEALNTLCRHLYDELGEYPLWIANGKGELVAERDLAVYAFKHFKPAAGLTPQETFACPGAIGATLVTFDLIHAVNLAKDNFKAAVEDYLHQNDIQDTRLVRQVLEEANYPGIKLKQVYRHIKTIPYHPRRIAFTKARNGSNKIITQQQAEAALLEAGQGEHIDVQLAKLSLIAPHDKLVVHRDIKPYWCVNIATFKDDTGRSTTKNLFTSLPLFYLHDATLPLPNVAFSQPRTRHKVGARADKKLEDNAFLRSISAYRYKR